MRIHHVPHQLDYPVPVAVPGPLEAEREPPNKKPLTYESRGRRKFKRFRDTLNSQPDTVSSPPPG